MTLLGSAWMSKNKRRLLIHDWIQKVLSVEQCNVFGSDLNDIIEYIITNIYT